MVPKLRLQTQSKKAERVKAENQYFLYSTLIRRAMVEAYFPTLVELVISFLLLTYFFCQAQPQPQLSWADLALVSIYPAARLPS